MKSFVFYAEKMNWILVSFFWERLYLREQYIKWNQTSPSLEKRLFYTLIYLTMEHFWQKLQKSKIEKPRYLFWGTQIFQFLQKKISTDCISLERAETLESDNLFKGFPPLSKIYFFPRALNLSEIFPEYLSDLR